MTELLFLDELAKKFRGLAPNAQLKHPFLFSPVNGAEGVRRALREAFTALDREVTLSLAFQSKAAAATVWKSSVRDRTIEGVTLVLANSDGYVEDVRVVLRPFPLLHEWRENLRKRTATPAAWELPPDVDQRVEPADPNEEVDPHFPVPLAETVAFHSPVLVRAVEGAERVRRVVGHAAAVYGARLYGPRMTSGPYVLSHWTGSTSNLPMEMVSLTHFDSHKRMDELSVFMQPWPTVMLFRDRVRARLEGYLERSFFELPSGAST